MTTAAETRAREACREAVYERDRGCAAAGIPGVPHSHTFGVLEVHELQRGSRRRERWLDPDWCLALCTEAHRWVTEHPADAQRRGLALPGWCEDVVLPEAAMTRALWRAGEEPVPSWM